MMQTIIQRYFNQALLGGAVLALSQSFMSAAWAEDSATVADLKARLAKVEKDLNQLTEGEGKGAINAGVPLHGFADVGYTHASNNDTRLDQAGRGFWTNSLDFYLTPQFSDNTKALVELLFEFDHEGGLATDLERIQFGHIFSDRLTVWVGRFHAPYGYWNTAFHHGAEIQPSILRPRFIDFEDKGGLLPSHVMGAWATGGIPAGSGKLNYDLYLGNGNALNVAGPAPGNHDGALDIGNSRDSNNNAMVGANFGYEMRGLIVGAHTFNERVNIRNAVPAELGEVSVSMTGLYGAYENDVWENIVEYYHFSNKDLAPATTGSHSSWLAFAQIGHGIGERWMPYFRFERASLDQADPYFSSQEYGASYARQVVGLRYTLNPKAVIKFEANRTKEGDGVPTSGPGNGKYSEGRFQYAISF